ncbi:MAG: hypothetical protein AAGI91_00290 [Bacteroidota bacterium]
MLLALALLLAAAAYGAFYVGAPGRQSEAVGPPRAMRVAGGVLTVAALTVSLAATGSSVGPVLVLVVMSAAASALALAGPFLLPEATPPVRQRAPQPKAAGRGPTLPPKRPPARTPKRPPTRPPSAP